MEYFIDTNFLIHYYFSDNLKWSEITSDNDIILHIPRVVQQEIDKHKNDGSNSIRAKKARKISQIFKIMLDSVNSSYSQKVGRVNVILRFFKNYTLEELKPYSQGLDLTIHDDIILASLKKYITDEKKSNCHFLSQDTGALTSAKACHIPYTRIPDLWQPPIPEDKEKEELRNKLKILEKNEPQIEINFTFNSEKIFNPVSDITLSVFHLLEEEIKTIANIYFEHNPPADDGEDYNMVQLLKMTNPLHHYMPPTETEIAEYREKHEKWKSNFQKYLDEFIERKKTYYKFVPFVSVISNIGHIPLEYTIVEFEVFQGGFLLNPSNSSKPKYYNEFKPPVPPKKPRGKLISLFGMNNIDNTLKGLFPPLSDYVIEKIPPFLRKEPQIDRYAFYHERSSEYKVKSLVYTCEEFRHQIKPEVFDGYFYLDLKEDNKFVFKITVSGKNMKNPVSQIYEINITVNYKPYYDDMLSLLGIYKEPSHARA
jgi:predicted nucleic acid-binding protein